MTDEDSFLGKTLKCFEIYFAENKMIVSIFKDDNHFIENADPNVNTNSLALKLCNKYDIPFILLKNEIDNKKNEFSKEKSCKISSNEYKAENPNDRNDYKVVLKAEGFDTKKSAFLSFNQNVVNSKTTSETKRQKSYDVKESVHSTKVNTFSRTSIIENKLNNQVRDKSKQDHVVKVDAPNTGLDKPKRNNIKLAKSKNYQYSTSHFPPSKVIKVNLADYQPKSNTTPQPQKRVNVVTYSDRDLIINKILNARMKEKQDKGRSSLFQSPKLANSRFSKDTLNADLPRQKDKPLISSKSSHTLWKKEASLRRVGSSPEMRLIKDPTKHIAHKLHSTYSPSSSKQMSFSLSKPYNEELGDENYFKIVGEIFKELDLDNNGVISIEDFKDNAFDTNIMKPFLPLKEILTNEVESLSKQRFFSICKSIYMKLSSSNKMTLIDWFRGRKFMGKRENGVTHC